jgi:hypothetical protein
MWSKIPNLQGLRAGRNWLREVAPDRQERVRRKYDQGVRKIKRALAQDEEVLRTFQMIVGQARFFGRVDGLREGLKLYEYGTRIQNENTAVFQTIMKFMLRKAVDREGKTLDDAISAERVCEYLDREIGRITMQEAGAPELKISVNIRPPGDWVCASWKSALKKKRNNVQNLISKAKKEAFSDQWSTLVAWKTWCRKPEPKRTNRAGMS